MGDGDKEAKRTEIKIQVIFESLGSTHMTGIIVLGRTYFTGRIILS